MTPTTDVPSDTGKQLSSKLRAVMSLDPTATAIEFDGDEFTWSYLTDAIDELEHILTAHGRQGAQRIGIVLRNRPAHVAAALSVIATGRTIITLSPFHGDSGLAEDVTELAPDVVVASPDDWERNGLRHAAEHAGAVSVVLGDKSAYGGGHTAPSTPARVDTDSLDGVAVLMLTSGTTGRPKRVKLTYDSLTAAFNAAGTGAEMDRPPVLKDDTAILWTPLVHIGGLYFAVSIVAEGRRMALLERFDVAGWAAAVRKHRPRIVGLQPTAMRMVMDSDLAADTFDGVLAVLSGTAPLTPEEADGFEERFGVPVLTNYGATEFAGAVAGWSLKDRREWGNSKRGSVGRAHKGIEMRVVDAESGDTLPVGETGILHVRGGQVPNPGGDGWTRTTDLASIDHDGFIYIHGRADDAINRGGFKIVPGVVADTLRQHPAIADAAVTGMSHARLGQVPVAVITLRSDVDAPEVDELKAWVADRLAKYFVPVAFKVVDELPRTPSLKVSQPALRELFDASELGS